MTGQRNMLYWPHTLANRLISVLTPCSFRVRKCVAPIQCLSVPKGCSTVRLRIRIISGALFKRLCISSSTASCSQHLIQEHAIPQDHHYRIDYLLHGAYKSFYIRASSMSNAAA